ncbi:MAG: baseplate J/gp47 family protein [Acetatifactor sp.]|nr:baseplate J/gp47 family protein [Acetatifactor sp.]
MFEEFDFDTLEDEMLSNISDDFDKREGSVIYDATAPAALMMANFYIALDMVLNEVFADSASYYYLIKRAAERQLFPYEETCAVGKMVVSPADVEVPMGERFNLDTLNYAVIGAIDGEQGAYKVQCETAGTKGNQQLGTLLPIEYVEGLETAELTEILVPGEEEEDVEAFRERYFSSFTDQAFGGNKPDYINKITSIDGVGACKIIRMWEGGYNPAKFVPTPSITSWFEDQSESTVSSEVYEWLKTVYDAARNKLLTTGGTVKVVFVTSEYKTPSSLLVQTVQQALDPESTAGEGDGLAPIGHVINVAGAENKEVDYVFSITYAKGYTFTDLKPSIEETIDSYHAELCRDWANNDVTIVRKNKVETLLQALTGIEDVKNTKINGAAENLTLTAEQIPVRGNVNG